MAKYQNLKYDRWTLEHKRGQKFELVGRIVELPEEVGDQYPKLLKKIEEKSMKKETVVTNENKVELKEDEKIVLNVEEKPVKVNEDVVAEEPVKEKKTRKKSKN
ncbi:hypothetical protein J6W34_03295 [bacterium]|nr:hypothetical protein [bacterium]